MPESKTKSAAADFEKRIQRLQKAIDKLKSDELPLDEALQEFEKGMEYAREAQKILAEAEQRIRVLTKTERGESLEDAGEEKDS